MKFQHDWTLYGEIKGINWEIKYGCPNRVNVRWMFILLIVSLIMLASNCYAGWECRSCGYFNLSDRVNYCGVCGSPNPNPRPNLLSGFEDGF